VKARTRAREVALQILYRYDSSGVHPTEAKALADDFHKHFEHFKVAQESREFAAELVAGTLGRLSEIDALLERHATRWKVSRMNAIDRSLLRMAVHELQKFEDIPLSVTLDEAIELAKQFGNAESAAFINGILDSIGREIRPSR